jgi:hypothetical protein
MWIFGVKFPKGEGYVRHWFMFHAGVIPTPLTLTLLYPVDPACRGKLFGSLFSFGKESKIKNKLN